MLAILVSNGMKPSLAPVYFVAEVEGRVVGGGGFIRASSGCAWLSAVAVAKGCKRQGVGSAVVRRVIQQVRNSALRSLWLETYFWNSKFYESLGFEGVRPGDVPSDLKHYRTNKHCRYMAIASVA